MPKINQFKYALHAVQPAYEVLIDSVKRSKHDAETQKNSQGFATSGLKSTRPRPHTNPLTRARGYERWTAFHEAAIQGDVVKPRILLREYRAFVDANYNNGITPLHFTTSKGHEAVVRLLLEARVDVNTKSDNGQTALQHAP